MKTKLNMTVLVMTALVGVALAGCVSSPRGPAVSLTPLRADELSGSETGHTEPGLQQYIAASEKPVLVYFMKPGCGSCRAFTPTFQTITREYRQRINIAEVDCTRAGSLPKTYNIRATPTLLLFKNGREVNRVIGRRSADVWRNLLDQQL